MTSSIQVQSEGIKKIDAPSASGANIVLSLGYLLFFIGTWHFLTFWSKAQSFNVVDPLMGVPFRYIMPAFGIGELAVSCLCLFTKKWRLALLLTLWMTLNTAVFRFALGAAGWFHPWVFVGDLTSLLNICSLTSDIIVAAVNVFLCGGALFVLFKNRRAGEDIKLNCPTCGGKTSFGNQWVGRVIKCPHCGNNLHLVRPS